MEHEHGHSHEEPTWLDRYWWIFLITFGVVAVLWLALFHPHW